MPRKINHKRNEKILDYAGAHGVKEAVKKFGTSKQHVYELLKQKKEGPKVTMHTAGKPKRSPKRYVSIQDLKHARCVMIMADPESIARLIRELN